MPASNRYLETEFEDARQREEFKRQRLKQEAHKDGEQSECESCLEEFCGCSVRSCIATSCSFDSSCLTLLLYIVFPVFAVADFVIGLVAKDQGWYERCVGQIVCDWSASACAVWIALALSASLVAAFAVAGRVARVFCPCCFSQQPSTGSNTTDEVLNTHSRRPSRVSRVSHFSQVSAMEVKRPSTVSHYSNEPFPEDFYSGGEPLVTVREEDELNWEQRFPVRIISPGGRRRHSHNHLSPPIMSFRYGDRRCQSVGRVTDERY